MNVNVDFELIQGTTKYLDCYIYDSDGTTLLDLSSSLAIVFGAKYYGQGSSSAVITKSLSNGVSIAGLGRIAIKLLPADTASLLGKLQYEIRITDPTGDIFTPISGLFVINPKSVS